MVNNPPASEGDARDMSSVPGLGISPGVRNAPHSSIFAWESPGQRSLGGYSPKSQTELSTAQPLLIATHTY